MNPILLYLLKVNLALLLCYAIYRLLFEKDTFFQLRRFLLLAFFGIALLYPLVDVQGFLEEKGTVQQVAVLYAAWLPEVTVRAASGGWSLTQVLNTVCLALCIGGWTVLSLRFLLRLAGIVRLIRQSPKMRVRGVEIRCLARPDSPFSFFRAIFIHSASHADSELDEILLHEEMHARQIHSADVLIAELLTIFCWMNPVAWLFRREVRDNLEYLADRQVLSHGIDSRRYQYHLLGLAYPQAAANLYNNFNVLSLKNRIVMMNKQQTKGIGRAKYLVALPLAAALVAVNQVDALARVAEEPTTVVLQQDKVYKVVEYMPEFPGGMNSLLDYIAKNIKYPEEAQKKGINGRVILQFIVNTDGSLSDFKIIRGVDPQLDAEALRVVKSMPKWTPGKDKGKVVPVYYTVPISFGLQ